MTSGLRIWRYCLPLREALRLKQGLYHEREGLLLANAAGNYGEVAPLPGLSPESLDDCLAQLRAGTPPQACHPALAWGYRMLAEPLRPLPAPASFPVNALLTEQPDAKLLAAAHALYAEGYRVFKLKVGQRTPETDLARISALLKIAPDLSLRLDANRSWSLDQALAFGAALPAKGIDYLEEPLRDVGQLPALRARLPVPLALDESLREDPPPEILAAAAVYVLKPMLLGPERVRALSAWAAASGRQVVLSSIFESDFGLRYLALLCQRLPAAAAAGLDTWRAFAPDPDCADGSAGLWEPGFRIRDAALNFSHTLFTVPPSLRLKWVRQTG